MTAETIAMALGGRKAGGAWVAMCPAHEDRKPSLSLKDADSGKVLLHCHAGCDPATVIATLEAHAAQRWSDEGRRVRIARPPQGLDFNDVLLGRISPPPEGDHHVSA